jgi:hypothetical protein
MIALIEELRALLFAVANRTMGKRIFSKTHGMEKRLR